MTETQLVSYASAMSTNCVFCDIVQGKAPATIVAEWDDALALAPLSPVTAGHVLVIPKKHVEDALADPEVSAIVMARASELAVRPCNLIVNVGREATQSVFHLHLHIVPRKKDDGLALPWYSGKGNHQH